MPQLLLFFTASRGHYSTVTAAQERCLLGDVVKSHECLGNDREDYFVYWLQPTVKQ